MSCSSGMCRTTPDKHARDGTDTAPRGRWRRLRKWLLLAVIVGSIGAGIGYYVFFVPSAEFVAEKKMLEDRQQELDRLLGSTEELKGEK